MNEEIEIPEIQISREKLTARAPLVFSEMKTMTLSEIDSLSHDLSILHTTLQQALGIAREQKLAIKDETRVFTKDSIDKLIESLDDTLESLYFAQNALFNIAKRLPFHLSIFIRRFLKDHDRTQSLLLIFTKEVQQSIKVAKTRRGEDLPDDWMPTREQLDAMKERSAAIATDAALKIKNGEDIDFKII